MAIRVGPDLVVSAFTAPTPRGGRRHDRGHGHDREQRIRDGRGASTTAFYLSANITLEAGDIRLSPSRPVPALAAGQSSASTTTVTLPEIAPGPWYLLAAADDAGGVTRDAGDEQCQVRQRPGRARPDVRIRDFAQHRGCRQRDRRLDNRAQRGRGGGRHLDDRFYLSTNVSLDASDVLLNASQAVPMLAPDGSFASTTQITLPADRVGTYYLLMIADADQAVAEASEGNNLAARLLQLTGR